MAYPSDFKSALERAAVLNLELIRRYRESAQAVRNPAVGRLLLSILDQKASQADLLRSVSASSAEGSEIPGSPPDGTAEPGTASTPGTDPAADLLRTIRAGEQGMEALFERLREAAADEENRERLHSLSETSRKIGDWARDHLELLNFY